jgi:hypothetical protein
VGTNADKSAAARKVAAISKKRMYADAFTLPPPQGKPRSSGERVVKNYSLLYHFLHIYFNINPYPQLPYVHQAMQNLEVPLKFLSELSLSLSSMQFYSSGLRSVELTFQHNSASQFKLWA